MIFDLERNINFANVEKNLYFMMEPNGSKSSTKSIRTIIQISKQVKEKTEGGNHVVVKYSRSMYES